MSVHGKLVRQYDLQEMSVRQLHAQIRSDFPNYPLHSPRQELRLVSEYVGWFLGGKKCTTVRYRPNSIDVPAAFELPLIEVNNSTGNTPPNVGNHRVGTVRITGMVIKPFAVLDNQDAYRDGFPTEQDLKEALQRLYSPKYGPIDDAQFVSVYTIRLTGRAHR
jgi:hypothetical protein